MALLVFGVFVVCALLVLLMGADTYQRMTERDKATYDSRMAVQYLTTRIRQADLEGSIRMEELDGINTLVATEKTEGKIYETRLYCYDNWLMELFTETGCSFSPGDGEKILKAEDLSFCLKDDQLQVELLLPKEEKQQLFFHLRSEQEVLP